MAKGGSAEGNPPAVKGDRVGRNDARARGGKSKKDKRVAFNEQVKTIKVESYKKYNSLEGTDEEKGCCQRTCETF